MVNVEITRIPGTEKPADYPVCRLNVSFTVSKFFPAGTQWGPSANTIEIEAQTITMNPYATNYYTVPDLQPGESEQFLVVFDDVWQYTLPWTPELYKNYWQSPNLLQDWYTVLRHGDATIAAKGGWGQYAYVTDTSTCIVPDQVQFEVP